MFFKNAPNLPDHEKARIEYHLQQIAECVGSQLLTKPILIPTEAFGHEPQDSDLSQILFRIGEHLGIDTRPIKIVQQPKSLEVCGGGG